LQDDELISDKNEKIWSGNLPAMTERLIILNMLHLRAAALSEFGLLGVLSITCVLAHLWVKVS
jgi:hypothetical protein